MAPPFSMSRLWHHVLSTSSFSLSLFSLSLLFLLSPSATVSLATERETHTVKVRTHVRLETAERTVDEKTAASECFIRETISKKHLRRKERCGSPKFYIPEDQERPSILDAAPPSFTSPRIRRDRQFWMRL